MTGYDVEGNYGQGWERLTTEDTKEEAQEQKRLYDEAEPETPHRVRREQA